MTHKLHSTNTRSHTVAMALFAVAIAVILAGGGCDSSNQSTSQRVPDANQALTTDDLPVLDAASLSEEMVGQTVNVTGEIVQQCPSSGCWLKLKSGDRETFVDLNTSPVRLSEDRVGQQVSIIGEVAKRGSDLTINAQQVKFEPTRQDSSKDEVAGKQ